MLNTYTTIEAASNAAIKLNITDNVEYASRYSEDPYLPENPASFYSKSWGIFGKWTGFLGIYKSNPSNFYETVEEASEATIKLGILTAPEYSIRYKEDPRLPSSPNRRYKDTWVKFGKWRMFFSRFVFYKTIEEASEATIKLGIFSSEEYISRYKEDPKLTCSPARVYAEQWIDFGRWKGFFGRDAFYDKIEEASAAVVKLGIKNVRDYRERYKEDPQLPSCPDLIYKEQWGDNDNWNSFLSRIDTISIKSNQEYKTMTEASIAAIKLGITTANNYQKKYKEDPRLPSTPSRKYKSEWKGFNYFIGRINIYITLEEAGKASCKLGITTNAEYNKRYKEDPRLPSSPAQAYKDKWDNSLKWKLFLVKSEEKIALSLYETIEEASIAIIKLGITKSSDYRLMHKKDPKLPSSPDRTYKTQWVMFGKWKGLFGTLNKA